VLIFGKNGRQGEKYLDAVRVKEDSLPCSFL